jgi:hypothetical protein
VKNQTTLNQDAPVAIANAIAKELMPSWMNYAQSLLREGILGRN